jgi:ATP-dependent RNA helicase HrpA
VSTTYPLVQALRECAQAITQCLRKDQHAFGKALRKIRSDLKAGREVAEAVTRLSDRIEQSAAQRKTRDAAVPPLTFPDLPVAEKKEHIAHAIETHQVVIVCGETGSGKTTQLPKICLAAGRGRAGFIGHTQPRRIAARTVAARIAEELGQPLGQAVGYKIRFSDETKAESLIKLMTDGILLAEIRTDPFLDRYDTLIIDEAHERSLNIDFLLGYLKWLLPKRQDLKLIITSATIDPERFSKHYDAAPVIEVSGRTYPVEVRYRPVQSDEEDETARDLQQAIVDAADELHHDQTGDILVFLNGEREIRETAESLRKHHPAQTELLPLYSRLSTGEQARIFKPHPHRRIVLATNVAETSLTVPGIHGVIDTGHARISRYSHRSKLQRLPIEKISQASANQRAGRCGRLGPGICIRLFSQEDYESRPLYTEPEILRTNLAAVILQMKTLGLGDIDRFPFVEPPDQRMIRDGLQLLHELNAIDEQRKLTTIGRTMARLPLDPRLSRMLVAAEQELCLAEVSIIVAALSVQDPRERPMERAQAADQAHAQFKAERSDFLSFLNLWQAFQEQQKQLSNSKLRAWGRERFLSYLRIREWQDIHRQITQITKGELDKRPNQIPAQYDQIHRALLTGLLSNIGFKQEQSDYLGARNLKFYIHPGSGLFKAKPKWIVAAEQVETTRVYGRHVAAIEPAWVERAAAHLIKKQHHEPHWERKAARAAVYERISLYGLVLQNRRKAPYERIDPAGARELFIRCALVNQDYDSNAPFFRHNQALLESVGTIQHKGRRVDLIADEEWLYRFYDERIPEDVVNGVTFDRWRNQAEKKQPQLLFLTRDALTRRDALTVDGASFPDELVIDALSLRLSYRFEPGHPEDGVTAIIPLHQLNRLNPEPFEWLVPGLLREKVIALIKSLPKSLRRHFVPAPDYADQCLARISYRTGSLQRALASALHDIAQVSLPDDIWRPDALSDYLRINFRIVDDAGQTVAEGRDLPALKQRYAEKAGAAFDDLAADALLRTGSTQWDFGDLPEHYAEQQDGKPFAGYPALVDEGATVGVKIFDTDREARAQHREGLIRLFQIMLRKETSYLKKNLPIGIAEERLYNTLPAHPFLYAGSDEQANLREDMVSLVLGALFIDDQAPIRSEKVFATRLNAGKSHLLALANESGRTVPEVLQAYRGILKQLAPLPQQDALVQDVTEQLGLLIYAGFLTRTPFVRLKEMPRYLQAISYRVDKSAYDRQRDAQKLEQLRPFWNRYWDSLKENKNHLPPELDDFRWSLEEFRVSLFAQVLKTAYPVSPKRLEKAWQARLESR